MYKCVKGVQTLDCLDLQPHHEESHKTLNAQKLQIKTQKILFYFRLTSEVLKHVKQDDTYLFKNFQIQCGLKWS